MPLRADAAVKDGSLLYNHLLTKRYSLCQDCNFIKLGFITLQDEETSRKSNHTDCRSAIRIGPGVRLWANLYSPGVFVGM